MVRKVVLYGDPVLRVRCREVTRAEIAGPEFQKLIDDMIETMYVAKGVGLAAPQVGEAIRLFVADIGEGPHVLINPRVIRESGEEIGVEGCLSIPGLHGDVPRAAKVVMRALDRNGHEVRVKSDGFLARVMQHEFDHLNGVLFLDKAIPDTLHWVSVESESEDVERV